MGFKISPVLWEKLRNFRLSAGRVQSVALRIICEREDEIEAFVPVEYWSLTAFLEKNKFEFEAALSRIKKGAKDEKLEIPNEDAIKAILKELEGAKYKVDKITPRDTSRKPQPPFITSTLQREASSKLGYGVQKTMQVAQKLYEGIELGDEGSVGLITYMRTDSLRISDEARSTANEYINRVYGKDYLPSKPNFYKSKSSAQDAHEAIRPTDPSITPSMVKDSLTSDQYKLYKIIWERFIASQMSNALLNTVSIDIEANGYIFRASGFTVKFQGFMALYE